MVLRNVTHHIRCRLTLQALFHRFTRQGRKAREGFGAACGLRVGRCPAQDAALAHVIASDLAPAAIERLDRVQTTAGGDYAVTILSFRFADPALNPAELCEMFRFRGDKCCEIRPFYFDPANFTAAVEAKKRA